MQAKNDSSSNQVTKTIITNRNRYPLLGLLGDDYQSTSPVHDAKTIVIERTEKKMCQIFFLEVFLQETEPSARRAAASPRRVLRSRFDRLQVKVCLNTYSTFPSRHVTDGNEPPRGRRAESLESLSTRFKRLGASGASACWRAPSFGHVAQICKL
ncbi:hypothetical protein EYF80_060039 [Liparis tanakae]|uniref:Uncharacterized protein n=1 Tax=Liparis tanakae TaxID=230148 RepID=A0A4Z2ELT5_9TELE|nr:hypothetical protein EYF80_060039 [Liparis tanakae]